MSKNYELSRRQMLTVMASAAAATAVGPLGAGEAAAVELKGRVKHSACRWCYQKTPLEELCAKAKAAGVQSIELLKEDEWPIVQAQGLECAVAYGPTAIARGWNDAAREDEFVKEAERLLPIIAAAGIPHMICFSGLRRNVDDATGLTNCAKGLKRVAPMAESAGVTVIMELLNSTVDHPYYQCDKTEWGKALVDEVGSSRFKLLYDIYHMATMGDDVIPTIQANKDYFAHYHTGGVPGRHEIDETQTLDYTAITTAIYETGYTGYVGQEFIPTWDDPFAALAKAVQICDV